MKKFLLILYIPLFSTFLVAQNICNNGECYNVPQSILPVLSRTTNTIVLGSAGNIFLGEVSSQDHFELNSKIQFSENDLAISLGILPWANGFESGSFIGSIAAYKKLDNKQSFSGGIKYLSLGSFDHVNSNGELLQSYRPAEFQIRLAYQRLLMESLSIGANLNYVNSQFANGAESSNGLMLEAVNAFAIGVNSFYLKNNDWGKYNFGVAIDNLGPKVSHIKDGKEGYALPARIAIGAGIEKDIIDDITIFAGLQISKAMVPVADTIDANGNGINDNFENSAVSTWFKSFSDAPNGFSGELAEFIPSLNIGMIYKNAVRAGIGYQHQSLSSGNRKFVGVFVGFRKDKFEVNAAYNIGVTDPTFNSQNSLGISFEYLLNK